MDKDKGNITHVEKQFNFYDNSQHNEVHGDQHNYFGTVPTEIVNQPAEPPIDLDAEARACFVKAESAQLLPHVGQPYDWRRRTSLLDYFLGRVFCDDEPALQKGLVIWTKTTSKPLPRMLCNKLFNRKDCGSYREQQTRKQAKAPEGHEEVDALFGE